MTRLREPTLPNNVKSLYVPIYIIPGLASVRPMQVSWMPLEGSERLNIPIILSRSTQLRLWHIDCLDTEPVREFGYTAHDLMRRIKKEALLSLANELPSYAIDVDSIVGWGRWVKGICGKAIKRELEAYAKLQ